MSLRDKGEGHAPSGLPSSHPPKVPLSEESAEQKSVRVKRRRTRRERNDLKFGRKATGKIPDQRPNRRGLKKVLPPFWSSQLSHCAKSTPIKGSHLAKSVIITQNRLTQHLGIFNREVKSADIERLLSPNQVEHDTLDVTPIQKASGGLLGEEIQSCSSLDAHQKSIPGELGEGTLKDLNPAQEDSHFTITPAAPASVRAPHPVAAVQEADVAGYEPSLASPAATFDPQATEEAAFQSNTTVGANDKENVPPPPVEGGGELRKRTPLAKELAQDLEKLLDLKAVFPGRDLISEMRQTVINALLQQRKSLPDGSALTLLRKKADFRSPDNRGQTKSLLEQKSSNGKNRNSEQSVSLKSQKGREQNFLSCFSHDPTQRVADDRLSRREGFELIAEPEVRDPDSFFLTAAPRPRSLLSTSSESVNSARSCFALPEEQCAPPPAVRAARPWEQSPGESRGRQERPEGKRRGPLKKRAISQRHHQGRQPLAARDSFGSAGLSKNPGVLLLADPQPHPFGYKLSPDRWTSQEAECIPGYNLYPSQELHNSPLLDLGLTTTARAGQESQTSFDVLKSIWSPKLPRKEAKLPASQALACSSLAHLPLPPRDLNTEQGRPKEFFQLNVISQQPHSSFYRQCFQQDVSAPSRLPPLKNGLPAPGKPRLYYQKLSAEPGRTSHQNYQFWGLAEASEKMPSSREKGASRAGSQICGLERLLHWGNAQQLQALQQLPMSYFPPSEALEKGSSPLCTLQGHLWGQASPEPWTFPRMKLY